MALGPRGARCLSCTARAKRHAGARPSAQTLGVTTAAVDSYLQQSLSTGSPPLGGQTTYPPDLVPLDRLASILTVVVTCLQAKSPAEALLRHEDWHEHDGYITISKPCTWAELVALVASPETLYASRPDDDFVRIGVYAPNGAFYLRVWVPDEDDDPQYYPGRWGTFDLSASKELLVEVARVLPGQELSRSASKAFFEQRGVA